MTISMRSIGTSNSQRASIASKPLFISVAESIVILRPMSQVGWRSASRGVTRSRSRSGQVAEGAAGGREDELLDGGDVLAPEALPDGAVLAVDGAQLAAGRAPPRA